jgi:quercetin dioxygenase-like cupin family protein
VSGRTPALLNATRVSFAPGARTAWHTYPLGKALYVVSGIGCVQLKGEQPHPIRSGDSFWMDPGEVHWHGTITGRSMVHIAIQNADEHVIDVVWMEQVADAEYSLALPASNR